MARLCDCPICGGQLFGKLSETLFIQNEVYCDTCGFSESLVEAVARSDGFSFPEEDIPIASLAILN